MKGGGIEFGGHLGLFFCFVLFLYHNPWVTAQNDTEDDSDIVEPKNMDLWVQFITFMQMKFLVIEASFQT